MRYQMRAHPEIVVDAFQLTAARRCDKSTWISWMHVAWNTPIDARGSLYPARPGVADGPLMLNTAYGPMRVEFGDYLTCEADGSVHVHAPLQFEATYKAVEGDPETHHAQGFYQSTRGS